MRSGFQCNIIFATSCITNSLNKLIFIAGYSYPKPAIPFELPKIAQKSVAVVQTTKAPLPVPKYLPPPPPPTQRSQG